jgi:peroxiredoxin
MRKSMLLIVLISLIVLGCRSTKEDNSNKEGPANNAASNEPANTPANNTASNSNTEVKDPTDPEFCLLPPEAQDEDLGGKLKVGEAAPDFALTDINTGKDVSPADFKGKYVLVFFWASWCPYCKAMCKRGGSLNTFAAELKETLDPNVVILGVGTSSDDSADTQKAFLKTNGCDWPSTHDNGSKIEAKYGVLGVPTVVLLDGEGKVLTYGTFRDPYRKDLLEYMRQECLKPKAE